MCLGRWARLGIADQIGERLEIQIYVGNGKVSETSRNFKGQDDILDMHRFNKNKTKGKNHECTLFWRYV